MEFLNNFFGSIMGYIYKLVGNYGFAIVIFALFAKIITSPASHLQQKGMMLMKAMAPEQEYLKKKYGADQARMNEETQKMYKRYNYKISSSCLPLLIQFPLIISLFAVLRDPVKYVFDDQGWEGVNKAFLFISDVTRAPKELGAEFGFTSAAFLLSLVFPIISLGSGLLNSKLQDTGAAGSNKMMTYVMNAVILFFSYSYTQGLSIYWAMQSLFNIIQLQIGKRIIKLKLPEPLPAMTNAVRKKKKRSPGAAPVRNGGEK